MSAFSQLRKEIGQWHELRKPHLEKIQTLRGGRAVVALFITFFGEYPLIQKDADMVEEVLANSDCSKGVTLILDAPGGDGLAAERLIQVCKNYSKGDFETIVPARAKSAATMVCLGSDKILLSPTSELGPIDPQVYYNDAWVASHHIVKTYEELFNAAIAVTTGKIEPYLQQLGKFDPVEIHDMKAAADLATNIAVVSLKNGMMKNTPDADIKKKIEIFTNPDLTMSHGRAVNFEQAKTCGLTVEEMPLDGELWREVRSYYSRANYLVDTTATCKLVESVIDSYNITRTNQ